MSIPQKGWILVAIPLLAQLLFLGALLLSREHQQHTQEMALHTQRVLVQAESCHRLIVEAQTHVRGYILTENPNFVVSYKEVRRQIPREFQELAELVDDNTEQQQKVDSMIALSRAFVDWLNENLRLIELGNRPAVLQRISPGSGVNFIHELRQQLVTFVAEERRLDQARIEEYAQATSLQTSVLLGGAVLIVISSLSLLVVFSRSISRRVTTLIDNTRRLAEGQELAPPLDGKDELRWIDEVFHKMATAIRQKEQENELFVYSVSHDLRSPLVNLQGFSQELSLVVNDLRALVQASELSEATKSCVNKLVDQDAAEAIRFIQTAVIRLSGIIDSLLRLSRVGRVEFRLQEVDVQALVLRIIASMHNSLSQRGTTIQVESLPPCWGDPRAIDHVFANLIGNAVTYLEPTRPGKIEVGVLEDGTYPGFHTYYVKDNGLGIPDSMQTKVFIAFQRLHPEAAPGEGIGLALVRRVVERLGGKVWLSSREGEGSSFFVLLPATQESDPPDRKSWTPANESRPPRPGAMPPSSWSCLTIN